MEGFSGAGSIGISFRPSLVPFEVHLHLPAYKFSLDSRGFKMMPYCISNRLLRCADRWLDKTESTPGWPWGSFCQDNALWLEGMFMCSTAEQGLVVLFAKRLARFMKCSWNSLLAAAVDFVAFDKLSDWIHVYSILNYRVKKAFSRALNKKYGGHTSVFSCHLDFKNTVSALHR